VKKSRSCTQFGPSAECQSRHTLSHQLMTEIDDGTRGVVKIWDDGYRACGRPECRTASQGVVMSGLQVHLHDGNVALLEHVYRYFLYRVTLKDIDIFNVMLKRNY
jgi:hypothetical protein